MTHVLMPVGASAAGEAFELLSSRYLCLHDGLEHVLAPFYARLERGRWVQFDGVFARGGADRLVLEAKFHDAPVSLATPGVAARFLYAKEAGASGVILTSRRGFTRDILGARTPIEKVFLSWRGMRGRVGGDAEAVLTAALDPVNVVAGGFQSRTGARLHLGAGYEPELTAEGFAFLPAETERWVRRLPAATKDITLGAIHGRSRRAGSLDIERAWLVEDSLRGFAPCDPALLLNAFRSVSKGPMTLADAWKALWKGGFRGRRTAVTSALNNLVVIGVANKFRTEQGLHYEAVARDAGDAGEILCRGIEAWPGYRFLLESCPSGLQDKHAISAHLSKAFTDYYPYSRSLYNPAKVSGLLALRGYLSGTSSTSPS